uniref:Histidine--tRNA ligase, chloroplastic n=1 Tax=Dermonema virens TaxID=1077399 RepID=A0A1G4NRZ8_9FLOR|nr:Histidine-tRNA ligase [Dermonema virens]SCW21440.1 Histidine-tRNA ligase [Dermonema virens]
MIKSVRGMHDILPDQMYYWQYIYRTAASILDTANYQEIRTPIVESQSLFMRSIGENTDIINKELYSFNDRSSRDLVLRPEGTAGIARAILEHGLCDQQTVQKLWYLGPMFRYERPQQGRQRQFHQLGIECYGSQSTVLDAEIIYLAHRVLKELKCQSLSIEINSIGNYKERQIYENDLKEYLNNYIHDLDKETLHKLQANALRLLDSKNPKIQEILLEAPKLTNYLEIESKQRFEEVKDHLHTLGIKFETNNQLVRGLDYYNDTVFEIKNTELGAQNTLCGGGRYDGLTKQLGGKLIHAMGWGIGIERLLILIQQQINIASKKICFYIACQSNEDQFYALNLIPMIHEYKLKYELDLSGRGLKKQIQQAIKKNSVICLIIGKNEITQRTILIKWLNTKEQQTCSLDNFKNILPVIANKYQKLIEN